MSQLDELGLWELGTFRYSSLHPSMQLRPGAPPPGQLVWAAIPNGGQQMPVPEPGSPTGPAAIGAPLPGRRRERVGPHRDLAASGTGPQDLMTAGGWKSKKDARFVHRKQGWRSGGSGRVPQSTRLRLPRGAEHLLEQAPPGDHQGPIL